MKTQVTTCLTIALLAAVASDAWAQAGRPSARSLSLAGSYSARARGYEAPFWNPANLGFSDRPAWSIGLLGVNGNLANNALSYGQITDLYGEFLTDAKKSELLAEIREDNPDRMFEAEVDVGAQVLGVSIWRVAFGMSVVGAGVARIPPDVAELILFGNVGEAGGGKDFDLRGSDGLGWAASNVYLAYAQPITDPALGVEFSIGATARYVFGHALGQLKDRNTMLTVDPLRARVDAELISSTDGLNGSGWAIDLGGALHWGSITAGVAVQNLIQNLTWDGDDFELTLYSADADFNSTLSSDTTQTFAELSPQNQERVREFLDEADFPTRLRLGGVIELSSAFSVSADYEEVIGGMLRTGWPRSFSLGVELRPLSVLPLRGGFATSFDQAAYSAGLGLYVGPLHLDFAVWRKGLPGGGGVIGAASISIWPGASY